MMKHYKYYNELVCEKGSKKCYRNIPINNRLPIGTLESEETEEDSMSNHKIVHTEEHQSAVSEVDEVATDLESHDDDNAFDSVLIYTNRGGCALQVK